MKYLRNKRFWNIVFCVILAVYPMRHIHWGIDLWDTGYNYANFTYMGLDHMDSMWLFSTYLANALGHLFTLFPFGDTLIGMNFYTGLLVSTLALVGFGFCTKQLKMPAWIAFIGELLAISLCWCPTALLYNYLTYVLFLIGTVLLYQGLTRERRWRLFAAGVCLGANVLVRFSNLPEMGMILAVWGWSALGALQARLKSAADEKGKGWERTQKYNARYFMQAVRNTLLCLAGYLTALVLLLGLIRIRYGLDAYLAGIRRLFGMTDTATDYTAVSMIRGMLDSYIENLYWAARIGVIVLAGVIGFALVNAIVKRCPSCRGWLPRLARIGWCGVCVLMLVWLYLRGFTVAEFYHYGAILRPATLFLMLTLLIALIRILPPRVSTEEKLLSGTVILIVLLTPLGSNNKLYPAMNNLFLAAPYTLWECWKFARRVPEPQIRKLTLPMFPVKGILAAFLAMVLFQCGGFGWGFVFAEATGVQNITAVIENNSVLRGVKTSPERAAWMEELSAYANEHNLAGQEVILYGEIPSLSFYLQMPSAFNPWCDLRSYSTEAMTEEMERLTDEIDTGERACPVIIIEADYYTYLESGETAPDTIKIADTKRAKITSMSAKSDLLADFMERYGYEVTFRNGKFVVLEL